jgi:hypothetical protein
MYYITYRNQGKPELSPMWETIEEARKQATWAKECGMTSVKIHKAN